MLASVPRAVYYFSKGYPSVFWVVFPQQILADLPRKKPPPFNYFQDMLNEPQRGIRAGFLGINRANNRLAALYQVPGWLFDSLEDCFYFRAFGP